MDPHDNWLELAALETLGEVTAEERQALREHLGTCAECRAAASAAQDVTRDWLPLAAAPKPARRPSVEEQGRRQAFLRRAQGQGMRFSAEAMREPRPALAWVWRWNTAPVGAAAALAVVASVAGGVLLTRPPAVPARAGVGQADARVVSLAAENERLRAQIDVVRRTGDEARQQVAVLQRASEEARQRTLRLEQWLAVAERQSAATREALARAEVDAGDARQRLASDLQQLDSLRTQLEQVKAAHAADRATLFARQGDVEDLTRQLRLQTASVERSREMLAANRDIRDLMSARNLHIVDVHDTDGKGKQKKAFGRMFYTEGKSLIFYAYDLDSTRVANASFQVWGQKSGGDQPVSLGILYSDDQKQSRWAMSFNNPKVLSEIDSVFVTVEAPGGSTKPSNQRMMYAYLMTAANHQ